MECLEGKSFPLGGESSSSSRRDYEVFLSFRGPDTRSTITDSLYETMIRAGICVFKDDEELHVGEEIGGELLRAISNSKIYIPIFSKDYASSKWCLRELAHMVEHRKRGKKVILPIFYEVDASDLKLKTGSYGKALKRHKKKSGKIVAKQWEEALKEVAGIKGWNLKDHRQDELIAFALKKVFNELAPMQRNQCDALVGIHDRMEAVIKLLSLGTLDVRFVVIHGMGGIGKTTLANAIYERISSKFQSCSFLLDIRGNDILSLRKKLSRDILGIQHPYVIDAYEGRDMIEERLHDKKVILILDDMDKEEQLMKLASKSSWFGPGSRIIITTRNTHFLAPQTDYQDDNIIPLNHQDFYFYEMEIMQLDHALQLFSKHSFKSDSPPRDYISMSYEFVKTSGRLPLVLKVIGSFLHRRSMRTWEEKLKEWKKVPNENIREKLLISYEELKYHEQQIFLDIACHCIGEERIHAYYMWEACEFLPYTGLNVLIHLSLIKVNEDDTLWMHDQLRDLGREIVEQECVMYPEERSRLWCPITALDVVQNNLGTKNIVALKLTRLDDGHNFTSGEFSGLRRLRFLELDGGNFVGDFKNLLSNLTWLHWHHCPSELHATGLCLKKLAVLKLSESDIMEDWNGWGACMVNDNLKVIYLASCNYLKRTPNFSKCVNLERLVLKNCTRLEEVNCFINQLGCLKYLEIRGNDHPPWRNISPAVSSLLDSVGFLKSLTVLKVEYHDGVRKLSHSIGELSSLKQLSLRACPNLRELPDSIGKLRLLLHLDLGVTGVSALPDSIGGLESLLKLDVSSTPIKDLPRSIGNLRQLQLMILSSSKIRELPKSIGTLENLQELRANYCDNLKGEIPSEIKGLSQLKILALFCTEVSRLPMTINHLFNLKVLDLSYCMRLQSLPDLPTSLERLSIMSPSLQTVPDLSNLTDLNNLTISDCIYDDVGTTKRSSIIERGQILHPNLTYLGGLHKLQSLIVDFFNSDMHPTDLRSLSQLQSLNITCADLQVLTGFPSSLKWLSLRGVKTPTEWPMFSNLDNLSYLLLSECWFREIEFDNVIGQLKNLQSLEVVNCEALVRISNVSSLKEHQHLFVAFCPKLIEIEVEPSSTGDCSSTERPLPDALKLEKLCELKVSKCVSLRKAPNTSRTTAWNCSRLDGYAEASAHQGPLLKEENLGPRDLSPSSCSPLELVHMKSQEQQKEREGASRQSKEETEERVWNPRTSGRGFWRDLGRRPGQARLMPF